MFDPDGDQAAADSTRSSTSLDTGSSLNPRTDRRVVTASYTSITIASLPPATAMPVMKHCGPEGFVSWPLKSRYLRPENPETRPMQSLRKSFGSWWTLDARLRKKDDENLRLTYRPGSRITGKMDSSVGFTPVAFREIAP